MKDKLPPEMKRAGIELIFTLLGYICASALFFYLLYLLFISLRRRHR